MNAPEIVAKVLRQLAEWSDDDRSPQALIQLAEIVEAEDYTAGWCCPMCQEVQCDDGCPLEGASSSEGTDMYTQETVVQLMSDTRRAERDRIVRLINQSLSRHGSQSMAGMALRFLIEEIESDDL